MPGKRRFEDSNGPSGSASSSNAIPTGASSSKSASDPSQSTTTLLISSLPPAYTSESLSTLLSAVGPIRVAFIVTSGAITSNGEQPLKSKGYGFAKFVLRDDAEKAINELNGTLIDGKKIGVEWAKRRERGDNRKGKGPATAVEDDGMEANDSFVPLEGTGAIKTEKNVKNAYAARREEKRARIDNNTTGAVENVKDSRTIILEGGLDCSSDSTKKALQKKLKKLVFGINTGFASLQVSDILITSSSISTTSSNNEQGEPVTSQEPLVMLECPTAKTANQLAEKLHNTVVKGCLVLAKVKFESDLVERKGRSHGGGRLIVRNLGFEVTASDLATAFCPFGPIQSIHLRKGFAFIWYLRRPSAEAALLSINGTRIYAGMHRDRIEEAANHELTSVKRKKEKGRIVGLRGRIVAVDWALGKAEYTKLEEAAQEEAEVQQQADKKQKGDDEEEEDSDSDMDPIPYNEDDDDDSEVEDEDSDDMSPIPEDLAPPSDAEDLSDANEDEEPLATQKPDEGATLFIRNIQFEATEDELFNLFKGFGAVRYARIVMDPVSKRSRGTGFVNFYKEEDALTCLQEADRLAVMTGVATRTDSKGKREKTKIIPHSLLTADPSSALAAKLTLHGRVLGVSSAVTKGQADKLREDRDMKGVSKDRRNLYLMHEGTILPDSPLAAQLPTADVQNRQSSFEARRSLLRTNPALYVSRTRLAIRQIPLFVSEGILRRLAGWSIKAFNNDAKVGKRSKLTLDELREPTDALGTMEIAASSSAPATANKGDDGDEGEEEDGKEDKKKKKKFGPGTKVKQAKILRQDDRIDPLTGLKRSKGYGFLEMTNHGDALRVIRWANANPEVHKLLHRWWIEDLKDKIEKITSSTENKEEDKEARTKRMKDKLEELEGEDEKSVARQGKTLIIEFSIENAMTVKRRQETTHRSQERQKKRKRDEDKEVEEKKEKKKVEKKEQKMEVDEKTQERQNLGSIIGKKRRLRKAGGK